MMYAMRNTIIGILVAGYAIAASGQRCLSPATHPRIWGGAIFVRTFVTAPDVSEDTSGERHVPDTVEFIASLNAATSSPESTIAHLDPLLKQARQSDTLIEAPVLISEDAFGWYALSGTPTRADLIVGKVSDSLRTAPPSRARQSALSQLTDLARQSLRGEVTAVSPSQALAAAFYSAFIPNAPVSPPDDLDLHGLFDLIIGCLDDSRDEVRATGEWLLSWAMFVLPEERQTQLTDTIQRRRGVHCMEYLRESQPAFRRIYGHVASFDQFQQLLRQPASQILDLILSGYAAAHVVDAFATALLVAPDRAALLNEFFRHSDVARRHAGRLVRGPISSSAEGESIEYLIDVINVLEDLFKTMGSESHVAEYGPKLLRRVALGHLDGSALERRVLAGLDTAQPCCLARILEALGSALRRDDYPELLISAGRELAVMAWLSPESAQSVNLALTEAIQRIELKPSFGPQEPVALLPGEVSLDNQYRQALNDAVCEAARALGAWRVQQGDANQAQEP